MNIEKLNLSYPKLPKRSKEEILVLANNLLKKMTLDEKIGQLFQSAPPSADIQGLEWERDYDVIKLIEKGMVGSILSVSDPQYVYELQKKAVENSRLGIPLFFGVDIIHGCRTIFPINLAMACSFNPELIEESCKVIANESSKLGITMTYSPMVDLVRDPRWGRVMESNGEDPYLNNLLAKSYVRGFQQNNLEGYDTIAACGKHFAAYGAGEGGKEYNSVDMSERHLRQYYLPGYKGCMEENVAAFMTAFNIYDGIPSTANKFLLKDILREEWKYDGFVISDYTSTFEMIDHKYAKDPKDVAKKSILAGMDHEMVSMSYLEHLKKLVENKEVEEKLIDESVLRILTFKYKMGLFDNPYKNIDPNWEKYMLTPENRTMAKKAALESVVLLKNNKVLPIEVNKNIALIGPLGDSKEVLGAWAGNGINEESVTLYEGLLNKNLNVEYAKGCNINDFDKSKFEEAINLAKRSDIILLAMGESQEMSGEAASRAFLNIPGVQQDLVMELKKLNKPIILITFSGRPLELTWYHDNVDGIIQGWFLGTETGNCLADILVGDYNPSGKLAMSFPYSVGQVPIYYNNYNTGRPSLTGKPGDTYRSGYIDIPNYPLYPFGYGLSYTTFRYGEIQVNKSKFIGNESIEIKISIENTGEYTGEETVQLYIGCEYFSVVRPLKELKRIKKIKLDSNEKTIITFTLTKKDLAYYNKDMELKAESSIYNIYIGGNSQEVKKIMIEYKEK